LVNKFIIAIAAIVAVMATLIALPNVMQPSTGDLEIDYGRQHMAGGGNSFSPTGVETLHISKDGSATYSSSDPRAQAQPPEKHFSLSSEEFGSIKSLVLETGFMDIPATDYTQLKSGVGEFTKYMLTVHSGEKQKTISWVDPDASAGAVPPILTNIGAQLDAVSKSHA
jgi:hypothetical protein